MGCLSTRVEESISAPLVDDGRPHAREVELRGLEQAGRRGLVGRGRLFFRARSVLLGAAEMVSLCPKAELPAPQLDEEGILLPASLFLPATPRVGSSREANPKSLLSFYEIRCRMHPKDLANASAKCLRPNLLSLCKGSPP